MNRKLIVLCAVILVMAVPSFAGTAKYSGAQSDTEKLLWKQAGTYDPNHTTYGACDMVFYKNSTGTRFGLLDEEPYDRPWSALPTFDILFTEPPAGGALYFFASWFFVLDTVNLTNDKPTYVAGVHCFFHNNAAYMQVVSPTNAAWTGFVPTNGAGVNVVNENLTEFRIQKSGSNLVFQACQDGSFIDLASIDMSAVPTGGDLTDPKYRWCPYVLNSTWRGGIDEIRVTGSDIPDVNMDIPSCGESFTCAGDTGGTEATEESTIKWAGLGDSVCLTVPNPGTATDGDFNWIFQDSLGNLTPLGATNATYCIEAVDANSAGTYYTYYDDEAKALHLYSVELMVGDVLPVAGLLGLGMLAAAALTTGCICLRRRQKA